MGAMASRITSLTIVCTTVYSGAYQRKQLRVTGLCEGNSPGTGEFPAQRASNAENVSIWWRHQGKRSGTARYWLKHGRGKRMNYKIRLNMMTSSNGTLSALLALCEGNPLVTNRVDSPHKGRWRVALMFFYLCLNKLMSNQRRRIWDAITLIITSL